MPESQASPSVSHPIGSSLGDRFQLEKELRTTSFGTLLLAKDSSNGAAVHVLKLASKLIDEDSKIETLRSAVARAHAVKHRFAASVLELIIDQEEVFVISESCQGTPLSEVLSAKAQASARFSPRQVSRICENLSDSVVAYGESGGHGAVFLESIWITDSGTLTLANAGLGVLTPALESELGARLSPEVRSGTAPSSPSDVYGIGAVVYELLVGKPPTKGCQRPSQAVADISGLIDQFVGATTNPDASKRPTIEQIGPASRRALASTSEEFAQQAPLPAAPRPSLAQSIVTPEPVSTPVPPGAYSPELAQALTDPQERWLLAKGKLDYGPFSLASIVEQIDSGKITPGDTLVDNQTGNRVKVEDNALLADVVEAAKHKRDHERRTQAEVAHVKQERNRGAMVYVIILAAVLGVGAGGYATFKALSTDDGGPSSKAFAMDEAKLAAKITFPSAEQARKRRKKTTKKRKGLAGAAGSWDDSLNFDMGGGSSGSETLSDGQVNPVIQRSGGKLGGCLRRTKTSDAFIEFMVKGTGKVYQVRVNGSTSTPVAKCLRSVMFAMKFPSFDGIRSKHNFDLAF